MKIHDISQELTHCAVYPGDEAPRSELVSDMSGGELYNLTNLSLCTHNGTHIDAPFHFIPEGKTVDKIPLEKFIGPCLVICHDGDFTDEHAKALVNEDGMFPKRVLIRGNATVTENAARVFAENGVYLLGNESQTVGPLLSPMAVHKILLEKEVVLLEGVRLSGIAPGEYFLSAAPISIAGSDGSPCRAVLIEF